MVELGEWRKDYRDQFRANYAEMTDAQRNIEFFALWSFMPDFEYEVTEQRSAEEIADAWDRRRTSETTQLLTARFDLLLSHSFITESYGRQLRESFIESCEYGIYRPNELDDLSQRYRWDQSKNGGIFSPEEAPIIESEAYQVEVNMHRKDKAQQVKDIYDASSPNYLGIGPLVDITRINPSSRVTLQELMKKQVFLQRWKNQYIARFGKNPAEVESLSK